MMLGRQYSLYHEPVCSSASLWCPLTVHCKYVLALVVWNKTQRLFFMICPRLNHIIDNRNHIVHFPVLLFTQAQHGTCWRFVNDKYLKIQKLGYTIYSLLGTLLNHNYKKLREKVKRNGIRCYYICMYYCSVLVLFNISVAFSLIVDRLMTSFNIFRT